MSSLYYSFYMFKDPVYLIAWNAALAMHTFRMLPHEKKVSVSASTMSFMKAVQHDPMAPCTPILYSCFLAYGLAREGIRPALGSDDVKWYPVQNPEHWLARHPEKLPMMLERVRYEAQTRFRVEILDFARYEGEFESLLWGDDEKKMG